MRKESVYCPQCGEAYGIGLVELSRSHSTPACWWCRELGIVRTRAGMQKGEPVSEREFWEEMAKRLAAYAAREGTAVRLELGEATSASPGLQKRS